MPPTAREKWSSGRAEAEAVEQRDRPRAHRDDVAEDAADAGGGALERLDGGRVVVALGLEGHREPVAEVEHAGVLARPLQHARAAARQPLQEQRRVLVAAVLRPEEREDGELEVVRLALQQLLDTRVLPVREAELAVEWLFRDGAQDVSLAAAPTGPQPRRRARRRATAPHTARPAAITLDEAVTRRDASLLLLLSAIWGSSFLFIKLGVETLEPSVVVLGRLVFGALTLLVLLAVLPGRGGLTPLRGHLWPILVLGALNNAIPFWLLGFAETHLDSGLTAVIQAAAPIFTVILAARMDVTQRVTGPRLIGVGVGFVGVALLVGVQRGGDLVAALAVLGVALCYAASVLFAGLTVRTIPPLQVSIGQLSCAAIMMAPFGLTPAARTRCAAGEGVARRRSRSACSARASPTSSTSRSSRAPAHRGRSSSPTSCPRSRSPTAPSSSTRRSPPPRSPGSRSCSRAPRSRRASSGARSSSVRA